MTDHGPKMPGGPHIYHFQNLHSLPDLIKGVRVIKGIEANILDENGTIDIDRESIDMLDMAIVSFHRYLGYDGKDRDKNTKAVLKAIKDPKVKILGHPGNPQFPVDYEAVVEACKKERVLPEINNASFSGWVRKGSRPNCLEIAKLVKKIGWKVSVGSDSHCLEQLGRFDNALALAKEAGLSPSDVVNTSAQMVEEYILNG